MQVLRPPARMHLADWIEANVYLPETVSALTGKVRLWQFQRGICDAIEDPEIERVTVIKPVRVGYTTLLTATLAHYVSNNPAPILNVQPTDSDCRDYMVSDIEPTFAASPLLRNLLTDDGGEESARNTLLSRRFAGGSLKLVAARSPRNLRRHTAKILLLDEIDAMEAGQEGDPLTLAERRTLTFADRKIIAGSTPVFEHGPVSRLYAQSDMRVFEVPCPECEDLTEILWQHVQWEPDRPDTAHFACPHCGSIVEERFKAEMVSKGDWRATAPDVKGHAGFKMNALISPHANASWAKLAAEFLKAKNDPASLQVFTNTILGQPWREEGDELDESDLYSKREPFGLSAIPNDCLFITAGVDCQDDRLECTFIGHGQQGDTFVLSHIVIWGPVDGKETWADLDDQLRQKWVHPRGGIIKVDAAVVDSGDGGHRDTVMAFTGPRFHRRIVAGKGVSGFSRAALQRSTTKGAPLFLVGVDSLKSQLYTRLARGNSIRFSEDLEQVYFEQLASEKRVVRYVKGSPVARFERIMGKRAETLDSTVYAIAAKVLVTQTVDARVREIESPAAIVPRKSNTIKSAWLSG